MSSKNILSIFEPDITAYPHHAHLLSILNGLKLSPDIKIAWFANNYCQIELNTELKVLDFAIGFDYMPILNNCPWLIKDSISFDMINKKWNSFIDFIVDSIDLGNYIITEIDEYYISNYDNYNKYHNRHMMLIYGYDLNNSIVYAADFFKDRKYDFEKISFFEVENAYENLEFSYFLCGVFLYRNNYRYYKYEFDKNNFISNLNAYINCENVKKNNQIINYHQINKREQESVFGLDALISIINFIHHIDYLDVRMFYVIYAHNYVIKYIVDMLLMKRLIFINYNTYKELENVVQLSYICLNLSLKFNITHKSEVINRIAKNIDQIIVKQKLIFPLLCDGLLDKPQNLICSSNIICDDRFGLRMFMCSKSDNNYLLYAQSYVQTTFYSDHILIYGNCFNNEYIYITLDGVMQSIDNVTDNYISLSDFDEGFHTIRLTCHCGSAVFQKFETDNDMSQISDISDLVYLGKDYETGPFWKGKYGCEGYLLPGEKINYPVYGDLIMPDVKLYANEHVNKSNILLDGLTGDQYVNKCLYNDDLSSIDVIVTSETARKVSFYFMNWNDNDHFCGKLIAYESNKLIKEYSIDLSDLKQGGYVSFKIKGHIKFKIVLVDENNRYYSDIYGIFFD